MMFHSDDGVRSRGKSHFESRLNRTWLVIDMYIDHSAIKC